MKFDDLVARLRVFETADNYCALPGLYLVARLDGGGFTRLIKAVHAFEALSDERMRDHLVITTQHLVECGFRVMYGYTQSAEISLLLHLSDDLFGRNLRKDTSVLAGKASVAFSLPLGAVGTFDCRISQLPRRQDVVDYFRWQQEDAVRNALNTHCYWLLRRQQSSVVETTGSVKGLDTARSTICCLPTVLTITTCRRGKGGARACTWRITRKLGSTPLRNNLPKPVGGAWPLTWNYH